MSVIGNPILMGGWGGRAVLQPLVAAENRVYTPPEGVDGFNVVTVNVEIPQHSPRCNQTSTFGWAQLQQQWIFDNAVCAA